MNPGWPGEPVRVAVISPYPTVRAGLRAMLEGADGLDVVGDASPPGLGRDAEIVEADVIVVDVPAGSEEMLATIEDILPGTPLVVLTTVGEHVSQVADGGQPARGYLLKEAGRVQLVAAIMALRSGLAVIDPSLAAGGGGMGPHLADRPSGLLTDREVDVLRLMALGLPNKAIALRLGISDHTVKFHVGAILGRLGASSRTEAVMIAARQGLLPL
ncbi:MAG: DNA-binding response regulator [Dehalococcoidia bacterium]|nr:DNA-binding response regulator [Dehalococcoidia bacterium]